MPKVEDLVFLMHFLEREFASEDHLIRSACFHSIA